MLENRTAVVRVMIIIIKKGENPKNADTYLYTFHFHQLVASYYNNEIRRI